MNERELARIVRGALDESTERLPYRTLRRLAAARAEALAHAGVGGGADTDTDAGEFASAIADAHAVNVRARPRTYRHTRARTPAQLPARAGDSTTRRAARIGQRPALDSAGAPPPRLVWRIAAVVVPVVLLGTGLLGISAWERQQRADDLAALDAAMLADDVPIAAYADRGFGVFLRNVSWETAQQ